MAALFLRVRSIFACAPIASAVNAPLGCLVKPSDNGRHPWHWHTDAILVLGPSVWEKSAGRQGIDSQIAVIPRPDLA